MQELNHKYGHSPAWLEKKIFPMQTVILSLELLEKMDFCWHAAKNEVFGS